MYSFHNSFKLNGQSFKTASEIIEFSKLISEDVYLFFTDWFSNEDYIVVQTSGSTGAPKPICLEKVYMKNSAIATGKFFKLKPNTTALLCLSANYIAGKMMLVRAMVLGWHIDIVSPNSHVIIEKEYDFSAMVPLQLRNSLSTIEKVKKLIVGGGVVAHDLLEKIKDSKTEVFATYGMTETITHIAVKRLNHLKSEHSFYKTLPNVNLFIDIRGCLVIKADRVSKEVIVTNDIINLISDTQFEWLGRYDNVINSGGVKLQPEKIEEKLSKIISERFFVTGVKDEILGEKLILVVEGSTKEIDFKSIVSLSKYEVPKKVFFVSKFVTTETEKIQRKATLDLIK